MENEKLTPQQQREKILRDALWKMGDCLYFDDRMAIYRNALAEVAAIPDVPKCPNCGPLGNDFCTWKGHWTMDSGSIPDASVPLRHFEGVDYEMQAIAATKPVLSAHEFALVAADILCDSATDETAIGSLTVEISRRYWAVTRDTGRAMQSCIPSRAELIELMCDVEVYEDAAIEQDMARVLDALIKAGAVKP